MQPTLNIALRAARKAGEMMLQASEELDRIQVQVKSRNDFVTEVDRAVEKEVIYHLRKAFPEHGIRGEESGFQEGKNGPSDYEWIIDPLDGTTNFINGIPHYAISIACKHKGRLEHAVVYDPIKREEFTASRGDGAALNGHRIRVTQAKGLEGSLIGTGIPFNGYSLDNIDPYLVAMKEIAGQTAGIRRQGAASLDLAYVAAGRFDGFWEMNLKEWDIAAGILLIKEAGGLISDFKGGDGYLKSGNVICGSPKVFKALLPIINNHMGDI